MANGEWHMARRDMFRFEELEIWKLAIAYARELYDFSIKLPPDERYNLTDQLKKAALSISNNIAEGSGAARDKNFRSFLNISISSILETVNLPYFAKERSYISEEERLGFYQKAEILVKKIRAFKKSLKQ